MELLVVVINLSFPFPSIPSLNYWFAFLVEFGWPGCSGVCLTDIGLPGRKGGKMVIRWVSARGTGWLQSVLARQSWRSQSIDVSRATPPTLSLALSRQALSKCQHRRHKDKLWHANLNLNSFKLMSFVPRWLDGRNVIAVSCVCFSFGVSVVFILSNLAVIGRRASFANE